MSPRNRKVSDDAVFQALQLAMSEFGPHELTLAHVSEKAGLTPGLLVQRFGGKRQLMLAFSERFAHSAPALFAGLRAAHPHPLDTLRAYARCMAGLASSPEALSRNLAYLQIDLTDEAFRAHLLTNARSTRRELEALLRAAVKSGALLPSARPRRLAHAIESLIAGSLMSWACHRQGTAAAWLRRDLDTLLEAHLAVRP